MSAGLNRLTDDQPLFALPYNDNAQSFEQQVLSQHGSGVLSGLVLSFTTGLGLVVSSGVAQGLIPVPISGFTWNITDNVTRFVWLDWTASVVSGMTVYTGSLILTTTNTNPGGGVVGLGSYTASGGNITSVSSLGRIQLAGQLSPTIWQAGQGNLQVDQLNSRVGVNKAPSQGAFDVNGDHYVSGQYIGQGNIQTDGHILDPTESSTLTVQKNLVASDANSQWAIASGSDQTVMLPDPASLSPGHNFTIYNVGDPTDATQNHNVIVKNFAGGIVATLTPGQFAAVPAIPAPGGSVAFPGTVTPQATPTTATVTIDNSDKNAATSSTTNTKSFTSAGGPMVVNVQENNSVHHLSGVTYNGVAGTLTSVGIHQNGSESVSQWLWASTTAGTANVVATFGSAADSVIEIMTFLGASGTFGDNQQTPGLGTSATRNLSASVGDLVVDALVTTTSPTSGTTLAEVDNVGSFYGAMSTAPGASTTAMSYTFASSSYVLMGIVVQHA